MPKKLIGYCGVDSGQIMITDPCYVGEFEDDEFEEKKESNKRGEQPYSYSGASSATLGKDKGGQLINENGSRVGVAVSSGFGDGVYPVYAEYSDEGKFGVRVARVTIEFLERDNNSVKFMKSL